MISTLLLLCSAILLGIALDTLRRTRIRHTQLETDYRAMQLELDRHRQAVHSILRELQ